MENMPRQQHSSGYYSPEPPLTYWTEEKKKKSRALPPVLQGETEQQGQVVLLHTFYFWPALDLADMEEVKADNEDGGRTRDRQDERTVTERVRERERSDKSSGAHPTQQHPVMSHNNKYVL
ncbi:hypothetical protein EYF80_024017 [Liparis tanakae]|uniref:Uncharacterized protein n=1 Tax=Liparis tanakae TaxID=230148 RepID=A0A4Z2HL95_9TELE|nr:hypothetical protein EYF80_024017 [Liparis tanakae]